MSSRCSSLTSTEPEPIPSTSIAKLRRSDAKLSLLKENSSHSDITNALCDSSSSNSSSSDDSQSGNSSTSYESSDWEVRTLISTVSNFMPFKKDAPVLKQKLTQEYLIGLDQEQISWTISYDHHYDLYELFYPFNNLQSLLFSLISPYTHNDYKTNKAFGNNVDDTNYDQIHHHSMDWSDICSVNKIKDLITNLLASCSEHEGIKEDELYLMFSTPPPSEIIEQLRYTNPHFLHFVCSNRNTFA